MSINLRISNQKRMGQSHFKNKDVCKVEQQHENCSIQHDQRFLNIENYVDFPSKQKNEYLECFAMISKAFKFDFKAFLIENDIAQSKNLHNNFNQKDQRVENLQYIMCHNETSQFLKSFAKFTRRTNQVVYLLILRNTNINRQSQKQQGQLRILFINEQGRLIHILSNLNQKYIGKLNKLLVKHFTRLETLYVLDFTCQLQQSKSITQELIKNRFKTYYISPTVWNLWKESSETGLLPHSELLTINYGPRLKSDSIKFALILGQISIPAKDIDKNIKKALRFGRIHDFILSQLFKADQFNQSSLFTNQWINNVFAWYFNITQSLGLEASLEENPRFSVQTLNKKISEIFVALLNESQQKNQIDYNIEKISCYPDIFQISKRCIVCKSCKPKYGCMRCSRKYKMDISLCIQNCFKDFHKNTPKFLQKKFKFNKLQSLLINQKSTLLSETLVPLSLILNPTPKKGFIDPQTSARDNIRCSNTIYRHKVIKKKARKLQNKNPESVSIGKFNGVRIYNFLDMEEMMIQNDQCSQSSQGDQQEKFPEQEKSSQIEIEQSLSTDSHRK